METNKTIPTEAEKKKLKHLHPILQYKLAYTIVRANGEGLCVKLFEGLRTYKRQDYLYSLGRTAPGFIVTNVKAGYSRHNFGLAGDLVFFINGRWSWDYRLPWKELGDIGKEVGLTWGGDWKFSDKPHFQFTAGVSRTLSRQLIKQGGLDAVWEAVTENYFSGRYL